MAKEFLSLDVISRAFEIMQTYLCDVSCMEAAAKTIKVVSSDCKTFCLMLMFGIRPLEMIEVNGDKNIDINNRDLT